MTEPLVHEIDVACPIDHAFATFTEKVDLWWPKGHRRFDVSTLHHDAFEGGQLIERSPNGEAFVLADVTVCTPPHRIELDWHPGKITAPTKTVVTFKALSDAEVRVTVTHSEGAAKLGAEWPTRAALFDRGWSAVLTEFKNFIEEAST